MKTHGQITFEEGFNLGDVIKEFLKANKIACKWVKHYVSSPYEKARYSPAYVGQEVWIKKVDQDKSICITQSDYEAAKDEKERSDYLLSILL